jgi:hypothetical protein
MQFVIGVTVLECSFVKHSHSPLGVKLNESWLTQALQWYTPPKPHLQNVRMLNMSLLKIF